MLAWRRLARASWSHRSARAMSLSGPGKPLRQHDACRVRSNRATRAPTAARRARVIAHRGSRCGAPPSKMSDEGGSRARAWSTSKRASNLLVDRTEQKGARRRRPKYVANRGAAHEKEEIDGSESFRFWAESLVREVVLARPDVVSPIPRVLPCNELWRVPDTARSCRFACTGNVHAAHKWPWQSALHFDRPMK